MKEAIEHLLEMIKKTEDVGTIATLAEAVKNLGHAYESLDSERW